MTDIDVLCVGTIVLDVLGKPIDEVPEWDQVGLFDTLEHHVGGCAANTAMDLAILGMKTGLAGCVGNDAAGDFLRNGLGQRVLDISGVISSGEVATSYTFIMIKTDGRRRFLHHIGSSAAFREEQVPDELLKRSYIVHIGGSFLMPAFDGEPTARLLKRAKDFGLTTCLDTAFNPTADLLALIEPCLPYLDIFLPSIEEAEKITGRTDPDAILDFFSGHEFQVLGVKLGTDGCLIQKAGQRCRLPAYRVNSVDNSGAGDAFVAGFLYGWQQGWDIEIIGRFACATAAHCVQAIGCTAGIKPAGDILKFMEEYSG
jgi:sugar/nucleoside kinase (ribokinase family)